MRFSGGWIFASGKGTLSVSRHSGVALRPLFYNALAAGGAAGSVAPTGAWERSMIDMPDNLPSPPLSSNAETVLSKRYYRKGPDGKPLEDARALFWRVSSAIAQEEAKYDASTWKEEDLARAFYDLLSQVCVFAQFTHADERRVRTGAAFGLLRPAGGRLRSRKFSTP